MQDQQILELLSREALAAAFEGHSDLAYKRSISRYRIAHVPVGDKYHSREFVKLVEELAMQLVRSCTADMLRTPMQGLGIPTDFALIWDGVSIGSRNFARNETLLMLASRGAHPTTGRPYTRLLAAPAMGLSHSGPDKTHLILKALTQLPRGGFTKRDLRASFVIGGGDGAEAKGGENARHGSTGTAELLFREVFERLPFALSHWDFFHRDEISAKWAVKKTPLAAEIFDVSTIALQLFGIGSGRHILRGVASALEDEKQRIKVKRPSETNSTRPMAYSYRVTDSLYQNYVVYHQGLAARLDMSRQGKTSQTQTHLLKAGRRLTAVDFVTFMLAYRDVSAMIMRPFAMRAQDSAIEAVEMKLACSRLLEDLEQHATALITYRKWLFVSILLTHILNADDFRSLWRALGYTPWGRRSPCLLNHTAEMLISRQFKGCGLQVALTQERLNPTEHRLLHPRCQCYTMTQPLGMPRRREVTIFRQHKDRRAVGPSGSRSTRGALGPPGGRIIRVPEWAAEIWPGTRISAAQANDDPDTNCDVEPRFSLRPRHERAPLQLQGVRT